MRPTPSAPATAERGSALISAVVVLVLVGVIGIVLLHASRVEVRASLADGRAKKAFYLAEAGLESARDQLRADNGTSVDPASFDEELVAAAGPNGTIDFDPALVGVTYDAAGRPSGFTGYGDDVPVHPFTALGDGRFIAFLSNDRVDGPTSLNDANGRVEISAFGAGLERSLEGVQSIVLVPIPPFPSAVTLLGPSPVFDGGTSAAKDYGGDDCQGAPGYAGVPGRFVPVIGVIGPSAEDSAEAGVQKPGTFTAGPYVGVDTVSDVSATADSRWMECADVVALAAVVRDRADYVCSASSPCTHWATSTMTTITYVEGDATIPTGRGLLLVTGRLSQSGHSSWDGVILAIGKGEYEFSGGGSGHCFGGTVVANVAGPDRTLFTADDCSALPDGFGPASYVANGGGNKDTIFCGDAIAQSIASFPLQAVGFRQR